jgi:hypothetical protein
MRMRDPTSRATWENSYLQSLLDPVNGRGVRIPDLVTLPSSTFQAVTRFVVAAATNGGLTGLGVVISPRVTDSYSIAPLGAGFFDWVGATFSPLPDVANITALFEWYRPVSMSVVAEYIGTTNSDNGSLCASLQNRVTSPSLGTYAGTVTTLANRENVYLGPVRNGLRILWAPQDNSDLEYAYPGATRWTIAQSTTAGSSFSDHITNVEYPYVIVLCESMTASQSLRFTVTTNYEALADSQNMTFLSPQASPSSPGALSTALNYIRQLGSVIAGPVFRAMDSPFAQNIAQEIAISYPRRAGNVPLLRN